MHEPEDRIRELLLDNRFVDWVINPESPYAEYWLAWVSQSAINRQCADEARFFLLELRKAEDQDGERVDPLLTDELFDHIKAGLTEEAAVTETRRFNWWRIVAAAVVIAVIASSTLYYYNKKDQQPLAMRPAVSINPSGELVRFNGSTRSELVYLPDGSRVTLARGARIVYSRLMNGRQRNVSLSGEAFFDVAKNPEKPFYIRTANMVIKVLGTSFRVTALPGKESVVVKSGRVSVYLKEQDLEASAAKILLPKQTCTFSVADHQLTTASYSGRAAIEIEAEHTNEYDFEDAPLDQVLQALAKMYNLSLDYDRDVFKNCYVTISLENESLEQKLEVLTKTVGASFVISDNGINIKGKGCQ